MRLLLNFSYKTFKNIEIGLLEKNPVQTKKKCLKSVHFQSVKPEPFNVINLSSLYFKSFELQPININLE